MSKMKFMFILLSVFKEQKIIKAAVTPHRELYFKKNNKNNFA
jgi:hypothetical protein